VVVAASVASVLAGPFVVATSAVVVVGAVVRRSRRDRPSVSADQPLVIELMAACIDAGALLPDAMTAAATAATVGRRELRSAAIAMRNGGADERAWTEVVATAPGFAGVATACTRGAQSGAAVADELRRIAAQLRSELLSRRRHAVHASSVWLVLPLGLCFLPAFVLIGIAPVIVAALPAFAH
jgi:pilus assembly protein TadC